MIRINKQLFCMNMCVYLFCITTTTHLTIPNTKRLSKPHGHQKWVTNRNNAQKIHIKHAIAEPSPAAVQIPGKPTTMVKPKYDPPTPKFPYKIPKRLNILSVPRKYVYETDEGMPTYTPRGIRKSGLGGHATDRVVDAAWPFLRRLILQKRAYKNMFSQDRLDRMDRMIELSNATCYSKLANCVIDLKKQDTKEVKKKKGWSESEWKKHMEYIGQIAGPKKMFEPPPVMRGKRMKLEELLKRINQMSFMPDYKCFKRLSQEAWYRNPEKVAPNAMKYVITDRVKKLATPRAQPPAD